MELVNKYEEKFQGAGLAKVNKAALLSLNESQKKQNETSQRREPQFALTQQ